MSTAAQPNRLTPLDFILMSALIILIIVSMSGCFTTNQGLLSETYRVEFDSLRFGYTGYDDGPIVYYPWEEAPKGASFTWDWQHDSLTICAGKKDCHGWAITSNEIMPETLIHFIGIERDGYPCRVFKFESEIDGAYSLWMPALTLRSC